MMCMTLPRQGHSFAPAAPTIPCAARQCEIACGICGMSGISGLHLQSQVVALQPYGSARLALSHQGHEALLLLLVLV